MRHAQLLFVFCCAVLGSGVADTVNNDLGVPHVFNGTNYFNFTSSTTDNGYALVAGVECDNLVNGVATSATDVGNGTITVVGCGNKISNVTTMTGAPVNITIYGSDNDVENDVLGSAVWVNGGDEYSAVIFGTSDGGDVHGNTVVNNVATTRIGVYSASDNVVTGNTVGNLIVQNSANNSVAGNVAARGINVRAASQHSALINNHADYIDLSEAFHADVESNDADYDLKVKEINTAYNPWNMGALSEVGNYALDAGAPVIGSCAGAFDQDTNGGDGITCTVMLPPGKILSAGTSTIPGTNCSGQTSVQLLNSSDLEADPLAEFPTIMARRSLLSPMNPCAYVQYVNDGNAGLNVTINSFCRVGFGPVACTGTTMYSITSLKTTVIKHNTGNNVVVMRASSDIVESNVADYDITLGGSSSEGVFQGVDFTNNTVGSAHFTGEQNDAYHKVDIFDHLHVDGHLTLTNSNNLTVTNNTVNKMAFFSTESSAEAGSNLVYTGLREGLNKPIQVFNDQIGDKNLGLGMGRPLFGEILRFSTAGAGAISAITDDATTVAASNRKTTAVSAAQALAMQAQLAALVTSQSATNAALQAASSLIANLTSQVNTLKSGFCPPAAAGRHLLSTLTPIVPPAECVKAAPAAVTAPTDIVTTTLSLSGINLASFSTASVAIALAATAGINVADVDVVVTDYPVSTTVSFTGVALTSLTAAQVTSITNAIDAKLPTAAMVPTLGTVTPTGRRLLDLSFPVTVTAVGASTTAAAQTQTAVTSAATLAAAALAAGLQSSAASASAATVSAVMTITVRAASASSAAAIATALSPSNTVAITAQLAAAGVSNTGVTITTPVLSKPAAPQAPSMAGISGQDKKDLLALLVLLVIPIANAAYFGGKYLERRRAEAARTPVVAAEDKAVDVVVVDSA